MSAGKMIIRTLRFDAFPTIYQLRAVLNLPTRVEARFDRLRQELDEQIRISTARLSLKTFGAASRRIRHVAT